jgi:GNAT superfamily N-acetyltransferase
MPDLLVNLLKLPPLEPLMLAMENAHILIRRAQPFELTRVRSFVEKTFSVAWADEISVGFANKPVSVYIAIVEEAIVGFAGYECTRRGFFGPTAVVEELQGRRIGKALLLAGLWGMREMGYVYAIIGRAGPVEFYQTAVGATAIPDSDPGIYTDLLK